MAKPNVDLLLEALETVRETGQSPGAPLPCKDGGFAVTSYRLFSAVEGRLALDVGLEVGVPVPARLIAADDVTLCGAAS